MKILFFLPLVIITLIGCTPKHVFKPDLNCPILLTSNASFPINEIKQVTGATLSFYDIRLQKENDIVLFGAYKMNDDYINWYQNICGEVYKCDEQLSFENFNKKRNSFKNRDKIIEIDNKKLELVIISGIYFYRSKTEIVGEKSHAYHYELFSEDNLYTITVDGKEEFPVEKFDEFVSKLPFCKF